MTTRRRAVWRFIQFYGLVYLFLWGANVYLKWSSPVFKQSRWAWILVIPVAIPFCVGVSKWQDMRDAKIQAKKIDKLGGSD